MSGGLITTDQEKVVHSPAERPMPSAFRFREDIGAWTAARLPWR